eukprot:gene4325-8610_t
MTFLGKTLFRHYHGCYCLGKLGLDILRFNNYPKAILKLEKEIIVAKSDLAKKGFSNSSLSGNIFRNHFRI